MNYEVSARRANRMRCVGKNNWMGVEMGADGFRTQKERVNTENFSTTTKKEECPYD